MKKKLISLLLSVLLIGLQTGCVEKNELGNLSVVTGLFIEPQNAGYLLIADCAEFLEQGKEDSIVTKQMVVTASSLEEAVLSLTKESQLPLYFARAKVFLFGKGFLDESKQAIIQELFDSRFVAADILVLQANFSAAQLLKKEDSSFGLSIDRQLKKQRDSSGCKLYQLVKNQENSVKIPTVTLSENGFRFTN